MPRPTRRPNSPLGLRNCPAISLRSMASLLFVRRGQPTVRGPLGRSDLGLAPLLVPLFLSRLGLQDRVAVGRALLALQRVPVLPAVGPQGEGDLRVEGGRAVGKDQRAQ